MSAHSVVDAIHATRNPPIRDDGGDGLPAFPLDVLPPMWRDWCRDAAQGANAPVDYTALSLLTVAAGLTGGTRRISPAPAWREPCVLWAALVGGPGSGKTRGMQAALDLVRALQQRLGYVDGDAWRRHAAAREGARVVTSLWRRDLRNMVIARSVELDPLPDDAIEPPPPGRLIVEDPRLRAVAAAVHGNPHGVLLAPGALDGWLARTARQTAHVERHHWHRAWSAEPWTISHRQLLQIEVPAAVSLLGTLRPDALPQARAGDDDGTIGRCLFVCPSRPALQPLSAPTARRSDDAIDALARLQALAAVRDVPLGAAALDVFDTFRRMHDRRLDDLEGREAAWWSEGAGMVLRLAGVLTFLNWSAEPPDTAEPVLVSAAALRAAAGLWRDYLWPHACNAFGAAEASERRRHADKVVRWLATHPVHDVSREQIRREVLSQAVDAGGTDAIIALLVQQGWLRPVDCKAGGPGRPPRRWQVLTLSPRRRREEGPVARSAMGGEGLDDDAGDDCSNDRAPSPAPGAEKPLIRRCVPPSPRLRGEKGIVSAISATHTDATSRHPERSGGSSAKDVRYPVPQKIPRYARDDTNGVAAISATELVDATPFHVR
ncbi:DUF3987 domain-containing protein [Reyranella sp. CPCC 100927]|uniref:DUF3987 domain-containing protein n=1 Tax=Reyranella sp. CPCC 100927 TaxID=2599616 RepID=UPI0011B4F31B|nr:DUF3987 domain-containing protein [Reyranella sp. CPCC 100927]TWT10707.1 DUF3987 domain-containing protein [Reyranella sp. CPCC 100927]